MKTYRIISADDPETLSRAVNQHLHDGWELCGGLCAYAKIILQAVTKEAK